MGWSKKTGVATRNGWMAEDTRGFEEFRWGFGHFGAFFGWKKMRLLKTRTWKKDRTDEAVHRGNEVQGTKCRRSGRWKKQEDR